MSAERPYQSWRIDQIISEINLQSEDLETLSIIDSELSFRSTPLARRIHAKVKNLISKIESEVRDPIDLLLDALGDLGIDRREVEAAHRRHMLLSEELKHLRAQFAKSQSADFGDLVVIRRETSRERLVIGTHPVSPSLIALVPTLEVKVYDRNHINADALFGGGVRVGDHVTLGNSAVQWQVTSILKILAD